MFKTEEWWKLANSRKTLQDINERFKRGEKLTKWDLWFIAKNLNLPKGACLCQSKYDNDIVMDYSKCNIETKFSLDLWAAGVGLPYTKESIKNLCNGTYVKVK
jgi:hypothetical protein